MVSPDAGAEIGLRFDYNLVNEAITGVFNSINEAEYRFPNNHLAACCGCCAALKPRYKRLVDNIFPDNPQDGLVKANMDKLTFFAMKCPEKLDRIGEYLAQRLSRDVARNRIGFVRIAMEALDTLLVTCHAQCLNLFVESYLKMVQKLLECREIELQCLATGSFVKFANIEEDTPSYHRRYDFFVSRFSTMCHFNHENPETRDKLRVAGLRGLQGVVRKTVSDDLQTNIWEHTHMNKIVPSLLFNMQDTRGLSMDPESPKDEDHPAIVAETVFRDLVCRASYGNINAVIKPALTHLDEHDLWVPNDFAVKCFKIIMYSVQAQYGYVVVQMLMSHLDENSKKDPKIKSSIVNVLAQTVLIAAGGSIGPSVLEVFNTLLRHLRVSVDTESDNPQRMNDEKNFQEAIINTIGEFANNLPDYQKIEIMMFIMGKVPLPTDNDLPGESRDVLLQTMLMKTLLKVATKYKTMLMVNAFPSAFLEPLLRMSLVHDAGIRRIVQEILHTLIDRHDNQSKLRHVNIPKDIAQLDLSVEKAPRQDIMFMRKNGSLFYWHFYENMQQSNNRVDNFESIYCTLALICIEMGGDDILIELFRLALGIQQMATSSALPITHVCAIHALVAAYVNLMSQLTAIPALCQHVEAVIDARRKHAPFYLPIMAFNRSNTATSHSGYDLPPEPELLFDQAVIMDTFSEPHQRGSTGLLRLSWSSRGSMSSFFSMVDNAMLLQPFKGFDYFPSTEEVESEGDYFTIATPIITPLTTQWTVLSADFSTEDGMFADPQSYPSTNDMAPGLLFDTEAISEALRSSGHDTSRLATPYAPKPSGLEEESNPLPNTVDLGSRSVSEVGSISIDIPSNASTPAMPRRHQKEDITFDSLKKILDVNPKYKEEQEQERLRILETFRSAPFEDIVARNEAKSQQFHNKLNEILDLISQPQQSPGGTPRKAKCEEESVPIYEMQFPELFIY